MKNFPIAVDIFDDCSSLVEDRTAVISDSRSNCLSEATDVAVRIVLVPAAEETDHCLDDVFVSLLG